MKQTTNTDVRDRTKINMQSALEIKCWARELKISKDRLRELVEKVGSSAAAVRKELESRTHQNA
jgi:hypothetical protein